VPHMHCPHCHRNAWLSMAPRAAVECRHCGTELEQVSAWDARLITGAAREMRAGRGRFTRDAAVPPSRPVR
jgi:ribosomal protein S27E